MKQSTYSFPTLLSIILLSCGFNTFAAEGEKQIPLEDVQRFSTAISQIKNYYVKPVENKKLFDNAIQGMLTGLDPHSAYLDEDAFKELQTSTQGEFGGLGIEVTMEKGLIKVITPLDDTPAAKAGIKAGDYIIRIGKTPVRGLTLKRSVKLMRGKKGSKVVLTIMRKGLKKPLKLSLTRENIQIKSVKGRLIDNQYIYIRLSHFQALTAKDLQKLIVQFKKKSNNQIKGMVLDLRNNPGGLLDTAIETSDLFIDNDRKGNDELIVFTKGRLPGSKFTASATPGDILNKAPIVVLINGGSASGSEIVAGALKDNKRAILLGTKSFGKGSVQTVLPLDGKRGIKLTTALYYTPSGKSIQAKGIMPDITIKNIMVSKKENGTEINFQELSEADLSGHLTNNQKDKNKKLKGGQKSSSKELIHEDYQLHQALNILKGMSIARTHIP
jgi:carboxyl-terminal processing protease